MNERIERLREKVEALAYRVESFGDLGAERELEALRAELEALEGGQATSDQEAIAYLVRVA